MKFLHLLTIGVALICLTSCASRESVVIEPLPRTQYQKIGVQAYAGAASSESAGPVTARGTRYRSGSVSSAAADWSRWPAGTLFRVLATGELYEVDDFTDDVVGTNTILLYKPAVANLPGTPDTHEVTIEVLRWGSPNASADLLKNQRSSTAKRLLREINARYPNR